MTVNREEVLAKALEGIVRKCDRELVEYPGMLAFQTISVCARTALDTVDEFLKISFANIGYDIRCGGCADVFYTGTRSHDCDLNCTTRKELYLRTAVKRHELECLAPNEQLFYIQDTRSYAADFVLWWGPKRSGYYTYDISKAGLYTESEARSIERLRGTDKAFAKKMVDACRVSAVIIGSLQDAAAALPR